MTQLPPPVRRLGDEHAVPAPRTPLFGRQAEVAALMTLISGGPNLVTITGTGGIGKTRLAVEVSRQLDHQPVFVQLADADRADLMLTLSQAVDAARAHARRATDRYGHGVGATVLVLDTVDRLLGADHPVETAGIIWEAWRQAPDLVLMVTSRTRLTLRDEHVVPLSGLGLAPDGPAVEMFRERSLAVGSDLSDPSQDDAILAICRLLRGVPLAIKLAAARTVQLPPLALLARLRSAGTGHLLGVLASGAIDAPIRQRSMRATMSWSYQLLHPLQQALFRRLGVFVGSFSLEAAEWVCPGINPEGNTLAPGAVLDGLGALVDLHLLEPARGDPEFPRFTLLDVPRAYAVERLEMSGEADEARDRLLTWCLDFAGRAARGLTSTRESRWLDLVEEELPTIRTALATFAERADSTNGLTLIPELAPYWIHRGPIREVLPWLRTFLDMELARGAPDSLLSEVGAGWVYRLRLESADTSDVAGLRGVRAAVAARRPSAGQWFHCTDHLVLALLREGQLVECRTVIDSGIGRALGPPDSTWDDSHWLSVFLFRRAQLRWTTARGIRVDEVVPYAEEALAVARSSGHRLIAAWGEKLLGLCHVAERNWASAHAAMTAALGHFREIGDHSAAAASLRHLATILTELGGIAEAARCLRDAIVATRRIGDATGEMQCTWAIAFVAVRGGRLQDAARMDDALTEYLGAVERDLPAVLLEDYESAMAQARSSLGLGPRASRGHGWGWLRTRALEMAEELAATAPPGLPVQGAPSLTVSTTSTPAVGVVASQLVDPVAAKDQPAADPVRGSGSTGAAARASDRGGRGRGSTSRPELTGRELEILAAIASGKTNAQIAKDLFLSAKTVMHHSTSIYRKLGVRGRAEAVALAFRDGLLHASDR